MQDDINFGNADHVMIFTSRYLYKCLDVGFRVLGWFLVSIALRVAAKKTNDSALEIFSVVVTDVYFLAVTMFSISLAICRRAHIGLPNNNLGMLILVLIKISCMALLFMMTDPSLYVDRIVDEFVNIGVCK